MKKLFFIAVTLFAVTTTQAQTVNGEEVVDTLTTNSKLAQNKLTLPNNISSEMTIEQFDRGTPNATLVYTFTKHLTEVEIELIKNYTYYYYQKWQPKETRFNAQSPDIKNKKRGCVIIFYKL
jgi:hypothetical protein